MSRLIRLCSVLVATLSCLATAQADGLVQLTLNGALDLPGGAPLEIRWSVQDSAGASHEAGLRLHMANGTTAHDLATLLVARLRAEKAQVTFPSEHSQPVSTAQIFVESTTRLSLRLAPGLSSILTTCENAPSRVRLLKPMLYRQAAALTIQTSTFHAHTKLAGGVLLKLPLDPSRSTAQLSELLFERSLAGGLVGDRPSGDSWRPVRGADGAAVTGCSIEFDSSQSDWGLELQVQLAPPR